MRSRQSESLLLVPLLPIFFLGAFPILLFGLLGFFGVALLGLLLISVGLSELVTANGAFSEQVIAHGYVGRTERDAQITDLRNAARFAVGTIAAGGLIVVGVGSLVYFG